MVIMAYSTKFGNLNDIMTSLVWLVQSAVLLKEDCNKSSTVTVGSNELFKDENDADGFVAEATIEDDNGSEDVTISSLTGLTTITLASPTTGVYTVSNNARIRLRTPILDLEDDSVIPTYAVDEDIIDYAPIVAITADEMRIEPYTNVAGLQVYPFTVSIWRRLTEGTDPQIQGGNDMAALLEVLTRDVYLNGNADDVNIIDAEGGDWPLDFTEGKPFTWAFVEIVVNKVDLWYRHRS